ncbi:MAG TPA: hypothetical protein G4O18_06670 [Dehalococcoidia bacterium]|nr:hypothetical protein [Dehalococcoidia bacterium]
MMDDYYYDDDELEDDLEDFDDSDLVDDGFILLEDTKKIRNPIGGKQGGLGAVGVVGAGYLVWCLIGYAQNHVWSWTPWKTQQLPALGRGRSLKRLPVGSREANTPYESPSTISESKLLPRMTEKVELYDGGVQVSVT